MENSNILYLYYALSIILLIFAKVKSNIKIHRVLVLSFMPIIIVSIVSVLINIVVYHPRINAFELFVAFLGLGSFFYLPFSILVAIFIKILQKYNLKPFYSALIGTLFELFFINIYDDTFKYNSVIDIIIPISYFVAVIIEDKLFKGKKWKAIF